MNNMKAKEIEEILNNGGKLILEYSGYFNDYYYICDDMAKNRITVTQFEKYRKMCKNSDESGKDKCWFRGDGYKLFYWL